MGWVSVAISFCDLCDFISRLYSALVQRVLLSKMLRSTLIWLVNAGSAFEDMVTSIQTLFMLARSRVHRREFRARETLHPRFVHMM